EPDPNPITTASAVSSAHTQMDRSLATSLAWRATADWSSQILSWASLVIVARLLSPADFGIGSMAGLFVAFFEVCNRVWVSTGNHHAARHEPGADRAAEYDCGSDGADVLWGGQPHGQAGCDFL